MKITVTNHAGHKFTHTANNIDSALQQLANRLNYNTLEEGGLTIIDIKGIEKPNKFTLQNAKACLRDEKDLLKSEGAIMKESTYHIYTKQGEYIYINSLSDCEPLRNLNISDIVFVQYYGSDFAGDTINGEYSYYTSHMTEQVKEKYENSINKNIITVLYNKYGIIATAYIAENK